MPKVTTDTPILDLRERERRIKQSRASRLISAVKNIAAVLLGAPEAQKIGDRELEVDLDIGETTGLDERERTRLAELLDQARREDSAADRIGDGPRRERQAAHDALVQLDKQLAPLLAEHARLERAVLDADDEVERQDRHRRAAADARAKVEHALSGFEAVAAAGSPEALAHAQAAAIEAARSRLAHELAERQRQAEEERRAWSTSCDGCGRGLSDLAGALSRGERPTETTCGNCSHVNVRPKVEPVNLAACPRCGRVRQLVKWALERHEALPEGAACGNCGLAIEPTVAAEVARLAEQAQAVEPALAEEEAS